MASAHIIRMDDRRGSGPQLEDGYVRIANELFDAILAFPFTLKQQSVMLAIIRKTYGFRKTSDDISAAQLGKLCGMARNHVTETLNQLHGMGVITKKVGEYGCVIGINKRHADWTEQSKVVPKRDAPSPGTGLPNSPESGLHISPESGLQENPEIPAASPESGQVDSPESGQVDSPESGHTKDNFPKDNFPTEKHSPTTLRAVHSISDWKASFEDFWDAFEYKDGKQKARQSWDTLGIDSARAGDDLAVLFSRVMDGARKEALRRKTLRAKGSTPMMAQGWLSQRRFEDESLLSWGQYSDSALRVIDAYNARLPESGWPIAIVEPFIPQRAAAIDAFISAGKSPEFWGRYFDYVADNVKEADTTGIDWLIKVDTYTKIREGAHRQKERT